MAMAPSQCTFCISNWSEETTREFPDGAKLTRAEVSQAYDGDMSGNSTVQYLMAYSPIGAVKFIGLEVLRPQARRSSGLKLTRQVQSQRMFGGKRRNRSRRPRPLLVQVCQYCVLNRAQR